MSLTTFSSFQKLQEALHAKAKRSPEYRFYSLYDKIYRRDVLEEAWRRCKANRGAPGVDNQDFQEIESYGLERWLGELSEEIKEQTYRPEAVRRVWIPKANGKKRPLGIPTIRDRVAQTAAMIVLEAIFEADLAEEQYAYRPGRSALDAVQKVHKHLITGHGEVVDADLKGYFDTIPHAELMKSIARRVADGQVLALIKSWLEAPVEETDEQGRKSLTTLNRDTGKGTPQGSPISPLLSNLYMRRFIVAWKVFGMETRLDAHIVNYADDFVICCRGTAEEAMRVMRAIMEKLKLTVNEEKTRIGRIPEDSVKFLGYTIGRCYSPKDGHPYIGTRPSKEAITAFLAEIREQTEPRWAFLELDELIKRLNRKLMGWWNYFRLDSVGRGHKKVDGYTRTRIRQWLTRKHKLDVKGVKRYSVQYLYKKKGLIQLDWLPRKFSCAKA